MLNGLEELLSKIDNLPEEDRKIELGILKTEVLKRQREIEEKEREKRNALKPDTVEYIEVLKNDLINLLDSNHENQMLDYRYNEGYVSALDYFNYLINLYAPLNELIMSFSKELKKEYDGYYDTFTIEKYNVEEGTIKISFRHVGTVTLNGTPFIEISKTNNDIYLTDCSSDGVKEVFVKLHSKLSLMYDEIAKWKKYLVDYREHEIYLANANLLIDYYTGMANYRYSMFLRREKYYSYLLYVSKLRDKIECEIKCTYGSVIDTMKGHEEELLSKMYLRISDLPIAYQEDVKNLRIKQIENLNRQDEPVEESNIPLIESRENTVTKKSLWQKILGRRSV